ncbi:MAG: hypothetical protein AB1505_08850, partial [Candidatus Latescibacterota bacterium]
MVSILAYRLSLEAVQGRVGAGVRTPVVWATSHLRDPSGTLPGPNSLAAIGEHVVGAIEDLPIVMSPGGTVTELPPFNTWVSETRAWQVLGGRHPQAAVCFPDQDRVLFGSV